MDIYLNTNNMVKINFNEFNLFADIENKVCRVADVRNELADALYTRGQGVAFHSLAMRIFQAHGEMELTDEEYDILLQFSDFGLPPAFSDSLRKLYQKDNKQQNINIKK